MAALAVQAGLSPRCKPLVVLKASVRLGSGILLDVLLGPPLVVTAEGAPACTRSAWSDIMEALDEELGIRSPTEPGIITKQLKWAAAIRWRSKGTSRAILSVLKSSHNLAPKTCRQYTTPIRSILLSCRVES